jgi:hypothetical protein
MIALQYWKSFLLVLKLKEILFPIHLCFLIDENELENEFWQFSEILEINGARFLTCQR